MSSHAAFNHFFFFEKKVHIQRARLTSRSPLNVYTQHSTTNITS
jgi:hypothetical protein